MSFFEFSVDTDGPKSARFLLLAVEFTLVSLLSVALYPLGLRGGQIGVAAIVVLCSRTRIKTASIENLFHVDRSAKKGVHMTPKATHHLRASHTWQEHKSESHVWLARKFLLSCLLKTIL